MPQENNVNIRRVVKRFAMSSIAIINLGWRGTLQIKTLEGDSHDETFGLRSFFKDVFWYDMIWYDIWYGMIWYDTIYDIYLLQFGFHPVAVIGKLVQK